MTTGYDSITPIDWRDGCLHLLDQRELPGRECYVEIATAAAAASAIESLMVRGAPAIGITAAYAAVLSLQARVEAEPTHWKAGFVADLELLQAARPTAVNLAWAVDIMRNVVLSDDTGDVVARALATAQGLHTDDIQANRAIGAAGARLLRDGDVLLTHCNTGSLATAGYGTALGVVRAVAGQGRLGHVYVGETRPWLQGARLTAWELDKEKIPFTLVVDSVAASLMQAKRIHAVVVGADRVAANGDVANKIGTYGLAVLARHHGIPFIVAAPVSTIDFDTPSGDDIPIELRDANEVTTIGGARSTPESSAAWNPVFDVTPAALVDVLVTELGTLWRPTRERLRPWCKERYSSHF